MVNFSGNAAGIRSFGQAVINFDHFYRTCRLTGRQC